MIKKLLLLLLVITTSCKEKTANSQQVVIEESQDSIPMSYISNLKDSILLYYSLNKNREIWYNKKNREDLIKEIKNSHYEGLNPSDYNIDLILKLEAKRPTLNKDSIFSYDILLTENFEKLANHLHRGKLNPKKLYDNWDLSPKEIALSDKLITSINKKTLPFLFEEIKPKHITYKKIKESLILLEKFPDTVFKQIKLADKIKLHDTLPEIIQIKERLSYWKDYTQKDSIITPVYDSITYLAIKKFQTRNGLSPDGVIGKSTIKALNYSKEERIKQVIANLERWKWYPVDFGKKYLITNLPDYRVNFIINNDTIASHNTVVGTSKRKTPILISKLSNLVFNPTWTVPPTIIKEDLIPTAKKDTNYFIRTKIAIYDTAGNKITPDQWNSDLGKTYRYVQNSGYNNSLGLVKFNFPNKHLVYFHDTNHRDYFTREYRALSSGCVRIDNPLELSLKILKYEDQKWTRAEIDTIVKNKNIKTIPIKDDINVYILYWTNWLDEKGLQFRDDIYNLDNKLYETLRSQP